MNNLDYTYINVYRSMLNWEWYTDINVKVVFLHCLLRANHRPRSWRGIKIKQGEFITSSEHLAKETGLSRQNVRTALEKLISTNELTTRPTNKYTLINVTNYSKYQNGKVATNQQANQQNTNNQPTTNQQLTTDNKDNKDNKDNNIIIKRIIDYFNNSFRTKYKDDDHYFNVYLNKLISKGYSEEDFKTTIDNIDKAWTGTKMEKNIRPTVIFHTGKFSGYLNLKVSDPDDNGDDFQDIISKDNFSDFEQRTSKYSADELDKIAREKFFKNSETGEDLDD